LSPQNLTEDLQRKEDEYKRLESEKDCLVDQLKETITRVNELCDNPDTKNSLPGTVLDEKLAMERKVN
jgi:hypothetical protein